MKRVNRVSPEDIQLKNEAAEQVRLLCFHWFLECFENNYIHEYSRSNCSISSTYKFQNGHHRRLDPAKCEMERLEPDKEKI